VTYSLEGPNPSTLDDLESLDSSTSDGEVLIGGGDCVNHLEWFLNVCLILSSWMTAILYAMNDGKQVSLLVVVDVRC
jgi:hypothetical protein